MHAHRVVPLFPLRPLYFVFTNIIETSDTMDLKILQDIAKGLEGPCKSLHSILEIRQLCTSLLSLYADFAEQSMCSPTTQDTLQLEDSHPVYYNSRVGTSMQDSQIRAPFPSGALPAGYHMSNNTPKGYHRQLNGPSVDLSAIPNNDIVQMGGCVPSMPIDRAFFDQQVDWELFFTHSVTDTF